MPVKSQIPDMFSLLGFSLALVQYFPSIPIFLFGIGMYMPWLIYWKTVICFVILQCLTIKRLSGVSVETERLWGTFRGGVKAFLIIMVRSL